MNNSQFSTLIYGANHAGRKNTTMIVYPARTLMIHGTRDDLNAILYAQEMLSALLLIIMLILNLKSWLMYCHCKTSQQKGVCILGEADISRLILDFALKFLNY